MGAALASLLAGLALGFLGWFLINTGHGHTDALGGYTAMAGFGLCGLAVVLCAASALGDD